MDKLQTRYEAKIQIIKDSLEDTELGQKYDEKTLKPAMKDVQEHMQYSNSVFFNNDANITGTTIASAESQQEEETSSLAQKVVADETTNVEETDSTQEITTWGSSLFYRRWNPHSEKTEFHPLQSIFAHKKMQEFWPLFKDLHLHISQNSAITLEGDSLDNPGWVNGYVKPLHYIFIQPNELQGVIDKAEASLKIRNLEEGTLWLANQGVVYSTEGRSTQEFLNDAEFQKVELAEKILTGDLSFNDQQWTALKQWIGKDQKTLLLKFIPDFRNGY